VLAEAFYLLRRFPAGVEALWQLAESGAIQIEFSLGDHIREVRRLIRRYGNVPMSLADACMVRMAEIYDSCPVLTLDSDFFVYRKNGQTPLTLICPDR
jgi:predicted nucleic acid-binding protein